MPWMIAWYSGSTGPVRGAQSSSQRSGFAAAAVLLGAFTAPKLSRCTCFTGTTVFAFGAGRAMGAAGGALAEGSGRGLCVGRSPPDFDNTLDARKADGAVDGALSARSRFRGCENGLFSTRIVRGSSTGELWGAGVELAGAAREGLADCLGLEIAGEVVSSKCASSGAVYE